MNLFELLTDSAKTVVLDGAMGTQLDAAGLEMGGQNNITNPEAVLAIHQRYADVGLDLLITNTLTMNRVNIESHGIDVDVREVNLSGARLARVAAREGQYVLADIGSTGRLLKPYGNISEEEASAAFAEQALILAEGGVDGFIIETVIDLREALCALCALREVSDLPVLVSIAFNTVNNGGRTVMGNSAGDCARALTEAGADAVGANCGSLTPSEIAQIIALMRGETDLPLIAQPNAGRARLVEKRLVFDMPPADFAAGLLECAEAGARLLGGCCGTSPAHIQALLQSLGRA